jgi:hypothetical protein
MNKQAIKVIITIITILIFIPMNTFAEDKPESNSLDDISYYSNQDDLTYLYSLVDEGLMGSRDLYELDKMIDEIASNPRRLNIIDFDAIDFELYTKGQEELFKY